jgi:formamidopyrimidine-DNA glycosylase
MPELPDLQVFSHNLEKQLGGKVVADAPAPFKKALHGHKLNKVYREGKELRFVFSGDTVVGMHMMLHGKLMIFEGKDEPKYTIMALHFEDGTGLALTDYQKAAKATLNPEERDAPDALSKELTDAFLIKTLGAKKTAVKKVLMDQDVIKGIGNAYADEILYEAGISPFSISNKIPEAKVKALHKAIHKVLTDAEKQIKKSNPDIIAGEVRDFLKVHLPHAKETADGVTIHQKPQGGRKTYYTDDQELFE